MTAGRTLISQDDLVRYLDHRIAFWEMVAKKAWSPNRVDKCNAFLVAHRSVREFILTGKETPLPAEFDPEKWAAQVSRQF